MILRYAGGMPKTPEFPDGPEDARTCTHGNTVWFGHECGICEDVGQYLWLTIPIEECTEYGFHLLITDDDGYCNFCGYQEEE